MDHLVLQQDPRGDAAIGPTWPAQPKQTPSGIWIASGQLFELMQTHPSSSFFFFKFLTFSPRFVCAALKWNPKKGRCQQKPEITTYLCTLLACFFWRSRHRGLSEVWNPFPKPTSIRGHKQHCVPEPGDPGEGMEGEEVLLVTATQERTSAPGTPALPEAQPSSTSHPSTGFERQTSQEFWQGPLEMRFPAFLPLFSLSQTCLLLLASSELVPFPPIHPPGSASLYKVPFNTSFALL